MVNSLVADCNPNSRQVSMYTWLFHFIAWRCLSAGCTGRRRSLSQVCEQSVGACLQGFCYGVVYCAIGKAADVLWNAIVHAVTVGMRGLRLASIYWVGGALV